MRVLVTGSRDWKDRVMLNEVLDWHFDNVGLEVLIEGCARGADSLAEDWASNPHLGVRIEHFPAKWNEFGKSAGPRRNSKMLVEGKPDLVIAFHDDLQHSAGTGDMVKKAEHAGIEVVRVSHLTPRVELYSSSIHSRRVT